MLRHDVHVLSLKLAFILSQEPTLNCKLAVFSPLPCGSGLSSQDAPLSVSKSILMPQTRPQDRPETVLTVVLFYPDGPLP